ncbi:hypothetical protein, partial [Pseudomonas sp. Irchel s3h17]|uniref:hypothetical protein n=1 Tax=Pseudomonas sp. Irchel s3h17 TaxID=2009182 RepID=UPI001C47EAB6
PCLWLTLPLAGCVEDFHLQVTSEATTAKLVALARNAPCLAHKQKAPHVRGLFVALQCLQLCGLIPWLILNMNNNKS